MEAATLAPAFKWQRQRSTDRHCLVCERQFTPSAERTRVCLRCGPESRLAIASLIDKGLIYDVAPLLKRLEKIGAIHVPNFEGVS